LVQNRAVEDFNRAGSHKRGTNGQQFRVVLGPGDCCAADAPQTAARARLARTPAANAPPPTGGFGGLNVDGLPITKPPYGLLSAIDRAPPTQI
jgi:hypothetical protein